MVGVTKARLLAQWLWAELLSITGCLWWAKRQLLGQEAVIVLTLHRILDEISYQTTNSTRGIVVRERTFRKLIEYIKQRCEAVELREPGKSHGRLRVALTFDDGWSDNYSIAFPIVSANRIPITVFVCSGLIGEKAPFWPERVRALMQAIQPNSGEEQITATIETLKLCTEDVRCEYVAKLCEQVHKMGKTVEPSSVDRLLTWDEIEEMDRRGVRFGSHTHTHQILTTVPVERAHEEVHVSKAALEICLNRACDAFAYPNGNHSEATRQVLMEAGYKWAVTTERGTWTGADDPLAICRSNVCEGDIVGWSGEFSAAMFEYTTFWRAWRAAKTSTGMSVRTQEERLSAAL